MHGRAAPVTGAGLGRRAPRLWGGRARVRRRARALFNMCARLHLFSGGVRAGRADSIRPALCARPRVSSLGQSRRPARVARRLRSGQSRRPTGAGGGERTSAQTHTRTRTHTSAQLARRRLGSAWPLGRPAGRRANSRPALREPGASEQRRRANKSFGRFGGGAGPRASRPPAPADNALTSAARSRKLIARNRAPPPARAKIVRAQQDERPSSGRTRGKRQEASGKRQAASS